MRAGSLLTALLALLACAGENDGAADATVLSDTGAAAATPTTEVVQATLREWSLELSVDTVAPGAVSFQIANRGDFTHSFAITGEGEEWSVEDVASGQDATLRVDLATGIYDIFCPMVDLDGSHESRG
ncbi:MAG: hypothetical protein ACREKM_09305, partial [Longimicrobiales bacterium]